MVQRFNAPPTQCAILKTYRATVGKAGDRLKLEWARDTAFRFFPVVEDEILGFRLHDVDLAINKCLALANRAVVRDALDILELDGTVISLAAMVAAACCLFVDDKGQVLKNFNQLEEKKWTPHFGSVRGSWPRIVA